MPKSLATVYIWTNLIDELTVGAGLVPAQKTIITYLSNTGLFVEEKTFLANNRVRDG